MGTVISLLFQKFETVNVDDAVVDIVRQFKGVPDGLLCRAPSSSSGHDEDVTSVPATQSSLNEDDFKTYNASESSLETAINFSDNEEGDKDESHDHDKVDSGVDENGWHSDNELNSKSFPRRVFKQTKDTAKSCSGQTQVLETKSNMGGAASLPVVSHSIGDHVEVPPEVSLLLEYKFVQYFCMGNSTECYFLLAWLSLLNSFLFYLDYFVRILVELIIIIWVLLMNLLM